jgi:hypothetical protein
MTNREIAEAFFVSLRTVETHLTHVHQKLEVQTRDAAAGRPIHQRNCGASPRLAVGRELVVDSVAAYAAKAPARIDG